MKDIRIGNDIIVSWSIFAEGAPYSLEGKEVTLYLCSQFGKRRAEGYAITGNQITWTFFGKEQKHSGKYSLELVINEDAEGMITTDACDFVNLVDCSCKVGGADDAGVQTESIALTSTLEYVAGSGGGESYDDTYLRTEVARLEREKADKTKLDDLSTEVSGLSERVDELGNPVFKAIYGETKYEEIKAAYDSGKVVHCDYNAICYVLSGIDNNNASFASAYGSIIYRLYCSSASKWAPITIGVEESKNKVTTLSSSSTDTQYPSAKAVYDFVNNAITNELNADF